MNRHGSFIWYELMSPDPDASKAFYDAVVGWDIEAEPAGELDYRMIRRADGGNAGGVLRITPKMQEEGARPIWLGYIGVDDVDATLSQLQAAGGRVYAAPWNIPGVGRVAMVGDPEGYPFYVMRGEGAGSSDVFSVDQPGRVSWNELNTADPARARSFYDGLFGWTSDDFMPMGDFGDYRFWDHDGVRLGALCRVGPNSTPGWRFYIRVAAIDRAISAIAAAGGTVTVGPHEVPGGDHVVIGTDPLGTTFALVGPKQGDAA